MRNALIATAALIAGFSLPIAAQAEHNRYDCRQNDGDQIVGALVGGVLGGLLGSEIAEQGDGTEGTIIGAALGGLAGIAIADSGNDCNRRYTRTRNNQRYNRGYDRKYNQRYDRRYNQRSDQRYNREYNRYNQRSDQRYSRYERQNNRRYRNTNRYDRQYDRQHNRQPRYDRRTYTANYGYNTNYTSNSFVYLSGQNRPNNCRTIQRRVRDSRGYYTNVTTQECQCYDGQYRNWTGY